jgi:hypothetical protein
MGEEERALTRGITLDKYDMPEEMTVMIRNAGVTPNFLRTKPDFADVFVIESLKAKRLRLFDGRLLNSRYNTLLEGLEVKQARIFRY